MRKWVHTLYAARKPLLGLLGLLILVVWTTGIFRDRVAPGSVEHAPGRPLPANANTLEITAKSIPQPLEVVGSVTSDNKVHLSARIQAYVDEAPVSAGDRVTRGQLLIRLDDRDLRTEEQAAQAALRRARTEFERIKTLRESLAATEQQLVAAESTFLVTQADLERTEVVLTYAEIRAPFDGIVADRHVDAGTLAHPGERLATVYATDVMRLDAPIPVRLVNYMAIGDELTVQLEQPDRTLTGRVNRIVGEIDPHTRTRMVQVLLDTAEEMILPGTFGRLLLPTSPQERYLVPASAITAVGQLDFVYVVVDDRVLKRHITTGRRHDDQVEVLSGLQAGEVIFVEGPTHGTP